MKRIALVLTAAAVMLAMLVAFSAPALADRNNNHHGDRGNHHGDRNNNDVVFVANDGFGGFDYDDDVDSDDGDDFSPFFAQGCWEWSWVFERWEWDCD